MTNAGKRKYVYGPVPSRRLGRSLGVDLVPFKTCPFDCVYCQLGRTTRHTARRDDYVDAEEVLAELRQVFAGGVRADYVTLSGSGEPTLHRQLGRIIAGIKELTGIPVAVLTNSALLSDPQVRQALLPADLIVPSLDAADAETFARVNRPCPEVTFESVVAGLQALRREYRGIIRLEVLLVAGLNDADEQIAALKRIIRRIRPDAIELNTVTRPPSEPGAGPVPPGRLEEIRRMLGPKARVIALRPPGEARAGSVGRDDVLAMLRRRPCTLDDLAAGLSCHRQEAAKVVQQLVTEGAATVRRQDGRTYYQVGGGD